MIDLFDAMRAARLTPAKDFAPRSDGRLARYQVEGDKSGSRNGWLVLHPGPPMVGIFGSWRTGERFTWHEETAAPMTAAEQRAMRARLAAAQRTRIDAEQHVHVETAQRARALWSKAHRADPVHPYLQAKGITAHGLRQLRNSLVVPARDANRTLWTLQFIGPDGAKRFLSGGRIRGCYCALGRVRDALLLCEGWATAATIHEATGQAVAACFSCGNLQAVARALRQKMPGLRFVFCADNDAGTPGNPGLASAQAAARAVGGYVVAPDFTGVAA